MKMYKPSGPYTTPLILLIPELKTAKGTTKKIFPEDGEVFFCSLKSYGGTERDVNGVYSIEDTANVETWYRPDITSDCRVMTENGRVYEIMNEPENIEMRYQILRFKIRRISGGA